MKKNKYIYLAFLVLACILIALGYKELSGPAVIRSTPINTSSSQGIKKTQTPTVDSKVNPGKTGQSASVQPSINFPPPSGTFVSNHKPNLGNSPAPNTEESICQIPQGVSCNIAFNNGTTTLSLGSQTAGSNGIVAWRWSLQGIGLTKGTWTIEAIAKSGGITKTTTDPLKLQVEP